ncbi:TonB-dependent receptor [Reichenbachiella sp. 5M10]|uniref:TonB-dependent receptor n=1 Tax=Reichenbachiella sp. 5M10 TaxID=1889772 RepID=UPI000C15027A|nr:TonB-dependent receptor [Reichenbachiella sp. 5M10]
MRSITVSFLLICILHTAVAQNLSTLTIQVMSNKEPLEYTSVGIQSTGKGGATDETGTLILQQIPYGSYKIIASRVGYGSRSVWVTLDAPEHFVTVDLIESTTSLDEVVVSGTMQEISKMESTVPVDVYSPKFFKANPAPSVFESMSNINGVRPQINCNVCNTGDIHINGLEGPYTMVLIDGMPIVSGLSSVYGLTGIPQSLIERVEIVKGPASTLYGSEAVGGLINLITKTPERAPMLSADAFVTSWGEVSSDIGLKFRATRKLQSIVGIHYFNYQNPIDKNGDNFTDLTLQNRLSVFNKWTMQRPGNRQFNLAGRYVYEDRWGGEMQWTTKNRGGQEVYGESIYTRRWEIFGTYQLPTSEKVDYQFSANGHQQDSYYGDLSFAAQQSILFQQLTWRKDWSTKHHLLLGLAYRYTYYNDNTTATATGSVTHLPGAFVQDEIQLNTQNKFLFGLRYDHNSLHGNILTPRFNYKWNSPNKKTILRWSIGNGYRVANVFTEDHAALTGARDVVFDGELNPERSWNSNINFVKNIITSSNAFIGIDASAFYTFFNNRIVPDYETNPNQIIYGNLDGTATSKGLSINLDLSWSHGLTALVGMTWMDVTLTENGQSRRQLLTERFSGVWSLGYTFGASLISLDYTGNLYGPMRLPLLGELDPRDEYSPWFSIQNIQVTKKYLNGLEIYGGIKNLLNFTPPANSIARAHDPFDEQVSFDTNGDVIATASNPYALTFDPSYVYAPNQGVRVFFGVRYTLSPI